MRVTRIIVFLVFLITLAGFYSLYKYLDDGIEPQTLQATEEAMVDQVHVLAGILEGELENKNEGKSSAPTSIDYQIVKEGFINAKSHKFEAHIYSMEKTQMGSNFYVTDTQGKVLYDSDNNLRTGQDFSRKRDVLRTLNNRYGARSSRVSEEDEGSSIMYVGAPIRSADGKMVGMVTLYKPQGDVLSFIEDRRRWITLSLVLIGFGVASFTVAVFIWLFRPLGKLTNYARKISEGKRPTYPRLGQGREVNTLGKALHDMRESLEGRDYLENYVQMLTHELKSPLSAIKGAAELLNEDMPRDHRERFLSNIRKETERSQQIIDGLLKLSKLESLSQLQNYQHLEVLPILEQVVEDDQKLAEAKNIKLTIQSPTEHTVHGDHISIVTAFSNMLCNAIEFSPEGSEIELKSVNTATHIELQVVDQGTGIPDYAVERVFENFYSIARPQTGQKSSGLGLAFVREVAQLHHGYASIKNNSLPESSDQANKGATATLAIRK